MQIYDPMIVFMIKQDTLNNHSRNDTFSQSVSLSVSLVSQYWSKLIKSDEIWWNLIIFLHNHHKCIIFQNILPNSDKIYSQLRSVLKFLETIKICTNDKLRKNCLLFCEWYLETNMQSKTQCWGNNANVQSQWAKLSVFSIRFLIAILKFMFSKKAIKNYEIFTFDLAVMYLVSVKLTVKILPIFLAFLENTNFDKSVLSLISC